MFAAPVNASLDSGHAQLFRKSFRKHCRYQRQQYRWSANCFATPQPLPVSTRGSFLSPVVSGASGIIPPRNTKRPKPAEAVLLYPGPRAISTRRDRVSAVIVAHPSDCYGRPEGDAGTPASPLSFLFQLVVVRIYGRALAGRCPRRGLRIPAALLDKASPGRTTDPTGAFYVHRIWRQ